MNDMPQAVKARLFLYVDDSCLAFYGKDITEIKKQLNRNFTNVCEQFVDRISIYFGEDKTKSIRFASKRKTKKVPKLKLSYKNIQIKQY